jgi:hypothetical protein
VFIFVLDLVLEAASLLGVALLMAGVATVAGRLLAEELDELDVLALFALFAANTVGAAARIVAEAVFALTLLTFLTSEVTTLAG